jgi:hypothetical protein
LLVVLMAWLLKGMLSWRMLREEVGAVELALGQSLEAGRERLSWLVSRDTAQLSESQVRESAIESLAENLNDSVVAPIFWFVLLGLPGAAVYRFANTADAMWGYRGTYRGKHWEWAGKWAARATTCCHGCRRASRRCCWRWRHEACRFAHCSKKPARPRRPTAAGPWRPWRWRWVFRWASQACTASTPKGGRPGAGHRAGPGPGRQKWL